jgi:hypothetical protein
MECGFLWYRGGIRQQYEALFVRRSTTEHASPREPFSPVLFGGEGLSNEASSRIENRSNREPVESTSVKPRVSCTGTLDEQIGVLCAECPEALRSKPLSPGCDRTTTSGADPSAHGGHQKKRTGARLPFRVCECALRRYQRLRFRSQSSFRELSRLRSILSRSISVSWRPPS